jgi:hypothetical protein
MRRSFGAVVSSVPVISIMGLSAWANFMLTSTGDNTFPADTPYLGLVLASLLISPLILILTVLLLRRMGKGDRPVEHGDIGSFDHVVGLLLLTTIVFMLSLAALDAFTGGVILDTSCSSRTYREYGWFVLDSLAKGTIVDLLESFEIDLYRCPPAKTIYAKAATFLIRSYSTYVVVWWLFRFMKRSWQPLRRSDRLAAPTQ